MNTDNRRLNQTAMQIWMNTTCVVFKKRQDEEVYVNIVGNDNSICSSSIGYRSYAQINIGYSWRARAAYKDAFSFATCMTLFSLDLMARPKFGLFWFPLVLWSYYKRCSLT